MSEPQAREPMFNAPAVVVALVAVFVAIHLGRELLSQQDDNWWVLATAFIPARYGGLAEELPGFPWSLPLSFVTHALLHGDFLHLAVNSAWLLAVGTPIARRMPPLMFLAFSAVCGIGGAVMFLALHPGLAAPMVGASGAISGLMAAVFRLMFAADDAYGRQILREQPADAPRLTLRSMFTRRSPLTAIIVWVVVNFVAAVGLGSLSGAGSIAWEAHLGGFFTGLLAFQLFDRGNPAERSAWGP